MLIIKFIYQNHTFHYFYTFTVFVYSFILYNLLILYFNYFVGAEPERVLKEMEEALGMDCSNAILASAKVGIGIEEILEAIVKDVPPPKNSINSKTRALVFDSYYD